MQLSHSYVAVALQERAPNALTPDLVGASRVSEYDGDGGTFPALLLMYTIAPKVNSAPHCVHTQT